MEELKMAMEQAEILNRLRHWRRYSNVDGSYDPRTRKYDAVEEEIQLAKLEERKLVLAQARACATNRCFKEVLAEIELEVMFQLGAILAKTINPIVSGLETVVVEGEGEVCGVCQEEMVSGETCAAMECLHKFHGYCIGKWLKRKMSCPLCRYELQVKEYKF